MQASPMHAIPGGNGELWEERRRGAGRHYGSSLDESPLAWIQRGRDCREVTVRAAMR